MTAQERLGRLYHLTLNGEQDGYAEEACDCTDHADAMLAADPDLAQDIADGQAMRQLREALPDGWQSVVILTPVVLPIGPDATIAEAADACRKALEASRG